MKRNRCLSLISPAALLLCAFQMYHRSASISTASEDFITIATRSKSDKFYYHRYQTAYAKYFGPRRHSNPKLVEIGLGCVMHYGPGGSISIWQEFFGPNAEIWSYEFDKRCADAWFNSVKAKAPNLRSFVGDQSNESHLREFIKTSGGKFDIIIDDGLHANQHQQVSFRVLFDEALNPGVIYIIEDLYYSFVSGVDGHSPIFGAYKSGDNNTVEQLTLMIENLMVPMFWLNYTQQTKFPFPAAPLIKPDMIESIDCFKRMCVFTKANPQM